MRDRGKWSRIAENDGSFHVHLFEATHAVRRVATRITLSTIARSSDVTPHCRTGLGRPLDLNRPAGGTTSNRRRSWRTDRRREGG